MIRKKKKSLVVNLIVLQRTVFLALFVFLWLFTRVVPMKWAALAKRYLFLFASESFLFTCSSLLYTVINLIKIMSYFQIILLLITSPGDHI